MKCTSFLVDRTDFLRVLHPSLEFKSTTVIPTPTNETEPWSTQFFRPLFWDHRTRRKKRLSSIVFPVYSKSHLNSRRHVQIRARASTPEKIWYKYRVHECTYTKKIKSNSFICILICIVEKSLYIYKNIYTYICMYT